MSILHHMIVLLSADTKDFQKDMKASSKQADDFADKTKKSSAQTKDFMSSLKSMAVYAGVAGAALGVAKKAFDMGKEGAQLEYVRGKFDRLAESIGTTSNVLLTDLREATKGTRSDMELIGSAADFMSLGLAKSRDQVVRLTRVAGALNMDMNQLVLTLANKTTMRFDQLGVSVDGFDERVKKLEKSGLDVNAAFTEAFLQQAEEQIRLVGDAADTGAGQIAQMEARVANLSDTFKLKLAPAVVGAIDWLNLYLTTWEETDKVVAEGEITYRRAALAVQAIEKAQAEHIETLHRFDDEIVISTDVLEEQADQADRSWGKFYALAGAIRKGAEAANEAKPAFKNLLDGLDRDITSPIAEFKKDLEWFAAGGSNLTRKFEEIKTAVQQGALSPAEAKPMLDELFVGVVDLQEEIGQIDAEEAANTIAAQFGVAAEEAAEWLLGTRGPAQALTAITSKPWYIDIYYREHNKPPGLGGKPTGATDGEGVYDGKLQHGGQAEANRPYLVGESGPELFWPGRTGYVSPRRDGEGTGRQVVVNVGGVHLRGSVDYESAFSAGQAVGKGVVEAMRAQGLA